ncbi:MAG TPA: RES family NAD+ phosphorylase [Mucilaginibacter sp.]|jgi:hypothetical protein
MNLDETRNIINCIKSLELNSIGKLEMIEHISKLNRHVSVIHKLPAGTIICRSVNNFLEDKRYPKTIQEISYNPDLETSRFNRANWDKESTFYGSISDDIMKSYETSCMEIIKLQQSEKQICQETIFVGKWILQKDLDFIFVGGGSKLINITNKTKSRNELLVNYITKYPEDVLSLKMIDSFLCNEFSKTVNENERWNYKASAAYSTFLKNNGHPGLMYPSVQSNGAGLNIAIFPHIIDNGTLKLEYVSASIYYKRGKDIVNEYVMEAYPDGNILRWKEIYHHRLPPKMKAFYTGRSDDDSFKQYIPMRDLGDN